MKQSVDKIPLNVDITNNFNSASFEEHLETLSDEKAKSIYREKFFNELKEREGFINFDRYVSTIKQVYNIEKLDLFDKENNIMYFVKFGTPQKLSYVVDQAMNTLRILQHYENTIGVNGFQIKPKGIGLWLILPKRVNPIRKISELRSLIFLMKLSEWYRQVKLAGFDGLIRVGYEV